MTEVQALVRNTVKQIMNEVFANVELLKYNEKTQQVQVLAPNGRRTWVPLLTTTPRLHQGIATKENSSSPDRVILLNPDFDSGYENSVALLLPSPERLRVETEAVIDGVI